MVHGKDGKDWNRSCKQINTRNFRLRGPCMLIMLNDGFTEIDNTYSAEIHQAEVIYLWRSAPCARRQDVHLISDHRGQRQKCGFKKQWLSR